MAYDSRKPIYQEIEELRKRPLITYVTSHRSKAQAQMASDLIPELTRQISAIPKDKKQVDILVVSAGGDPTVSWRVASMLRERFDKVGALLPFAAFSAATLLALCADEILMHPFSNLGPVDPQLRGERRIPGKPEASEVIEFGAEDLVHYVDFMRKELGVTDQEQLERAFELLCRDVGAIPIGIARRSSHLALSMGEKLLGLHMADQNKAKAIAESLNKSFYHHGYPVGRKEAKNIGLPIVNPEERLENLMWRVWTDISEEMKCGEPFDPLVEVLRAQGPILTAPTQVVQIPAGLPPQVAQQIYQQIAQQIKIANVPPVDYEILQVVLESVRARSEYRTSGKIFSFRGADSSIGISVVREKYGWRFLE